MVLWHGAVVTVTSANQDCESSIQSHHKFSFSDFSWRSNDGWRFSVCQSLSAICRGRQTETAIGEKQTAKQMLIYRPPQTCRLHNHTVWHSSWGREDVKSEGLNICEWVAPTWLSDRQHWLFNVKRTAQINISNYFMTGQEKSDNGTPAQCVVGHIGNTWWTLFF